MHPLATLALRHNHPTLLSPLTSTPLDDFQSNAWSNSYRPPLAGLGITCIRDTSAHGQPPQDPQIDGDDELFFWPDKTLPPDALNAPDPMTICSPCSRPEFGLDSDMDPTASDIIGLIPDVNMYDKLRRLDLPHPGVNPLDTISSTLPHDIGISSGEPALQKPDDHHNDDILPTTGSSAEQSPSPRVIQDIMSILVKPAPEFSFPPWSSENSLQPPFSPLQLAAPWPSVSIKLELNNVPDNEHHASPVLHNLECSNTTYSSPILNAHLGIELDELISRAERFRAKYPERDIDRAWLSHFAGKLSGRGELLSDFRCYVVGCDQRNKRRDHILVHVGAHIGQRPFACSVWFVDLRLVILARRVTEYSLTVRCGSCVKMNVKGTKRVTADSGHIAVTFAAKVSSGRTL